MEVEKLQELNDQRKYIEDIEKLKQATLEVLKGEERELVKKTFDEILEKQQDKFQKM